MTGGLEKESPKQKAKITRLGLWLGGIAFTFFFALLGNILTFIPGFHLIGQMACAIILAVIYRQLFGYPNAIKAGIAFSSKRLLRFSIILYGLKLNIHTVLQEGIGLIIRDAGVIAFAILVTMWLAKVLKADKKLSLLLGVGTGVCGAAAVAAVAPIVKAKDEDTALGVGLIALVGTIFAVGYTLLLPILPIQMTEYALWAGMSLHEIAHVVLATAPGGESALTLGLLAKLGRVFLLVPLCFLLIFLMKRKNRQSEAEAKIEFPWFLVGFIALSVFGSFVLGHSIPVSDSFMQATSTVTTWCLTAAMVGLGLNVNLRDIGQKAIRPLIAMSITSILLAVGVYFIV